MATFLLTIVGGALGGPIGAALGAAAGQSLDARLFAPKGRSGPRLADLAVQSSTYGAQLPKIYGRARVAGSVIWATDLVEHQSRVKTGKGQPKQTVYSYSASFAVALAARPVQRVGRIWADGNLLRGAAGDFKAPLTFRFHSGSEDQSPDPLIAAAEGVHAPAFRGLAYAVFENFMLGDYGNRLPSLSFELIADEVPPSLATVLADCLPDDVALACATVADGFIVNGSSVRALLESLSPVMPVDVTEGGSLMIRERTATPEVRAITAEDLLPVAQDGQTGTILLEREAENRPKRIALSYSDPARDYQTGLQRARGPASGGQDVQLSMPLVLSSQAAKDFAQRAWLGLEASAERVCLSLPYAHADLAPGQAITVDGLAGHWQIASAELEAMAVKLELARWPQQAVPLDVADGGRALSAPDETHGPTVLHALDCPWLGSGVVTTPHVLVAANGPARGWRRAALFTSQSGGIDWQDAGLTAAPAIIGHAETALAPGSARLADLRNSVDVTLLRPDLVLASTDSSGLAAGVNLAMLGEELIQFRNASLIEPGRYRLSGLWRGRRGTEWAMAGHVVAERFVLLETATLLSLEVPQTAALDLMALGLGDETPALASVASVSAALLPPAPVHLSATRQSNGDLLIRWVRRSRDGWQWRDLIDAPLAEQEERYRVVLQPQGQSERTVETTAAAFVYDAAAQNSDQAISPGLVTLRVFQLGTFGPSRPAFLSIQP